jgi:hypothetical protein
MAQMRRHLVERRPPSQQLNAPDVEVILAQQALRTARTRGRVPDYATNARE